MTELLIAVPAPAQAGAVGALPALTAAPAGSGRLGLRLGQLAAAAHGARLTTRIVLTSLGMLLLLQTIGFGVIRASIDRNARATLSAELAVGERVWRRLLDQNAQKLSQGATLLAADFGFRSAVNSGDLDTISSALENNGARIGATVTALLDTSLQLRAVG